MKTLLLFLLFIGCSPRVQPQRHYYNPPKEMEYHQQWSAKEQRTGRQFIFGVFSLRFYLQSSMGANK